MDGLSVLAQIGISVAGPLVVAAAAWGGLRATVGENRTSIRRVEERISDAKTELGSKIDGVHALVQRDIDRVQHELIREHEATRESARAAHSRLDAHLESHRRANGSSSRP